MKKAVLLLTFNRLEYTKKVFGQIAIAKPPRLYLASDGPRAYKDGEKELVEDIRKYLLENINWECEVKTRFLETNSGGCGNGVSRAVTWFFDNEEDGIILEDDCVPNQSFFYFCEELLDYYKYDKRVWHISGNQFVKNFNNKASYYFAKIQHCWGWASWADRWKYFKIDLTGYDEKYIKRFSKDKNVRNYWINILNEMKRKEVDTWDYSWTFCIIKNNGFCINPSKNLVSNIGVNVVHFENNSDNPLLTLNTYDIDNIIHPKKINFDKYSVDYIYTNVFFIKPDNNKLKILKIENLEKYTKIIFLNLIKITIKKKVDKNISKSNNIITEEKVLSDHDIFTRYSIKPRFIQETIQFKNHNFIIPDAPSFAYQVKDIFIDNLYKFKTNSIEPIIYDCGSNIGVSILFFKELFPNSKIKAFEADVNIYKILLENINYIDGLEVFNNAIWINNSNISFNSEGADGGSIINNFENKQNVKAVRLKDIIQKEENIDFLKIDIEGAEYEVVKDCKIELKKVSNIFLEYHSILNTKQNLGEILTILSDAGFRYHLSNLSHQPNIYIQRNIWNNMDLQVNIFGYR